MMFRVSLIRTKVEVAYVVVEADIRDVAEVLATHEVQEEYWQPVVNDGPRVIDAYQS